MLREGTTHIIYKPAFCRRKQSSIINPFMNPNTGVAGSCHSQTTLYIPLNVHDRIFFHPMQYQNSHEALSS